MFWVMSAFTTPRRSSSATPRWAAFGSTSASASKRGRWKAQKRSGSLTKVERDPTSIGS